MEDKIRYARIKQITAGAFTFVEVMIALAIVSISFLALIRLDIISIGMADTAEITSQAVLLADGKIAETLAIGYPKKETTAGVVEKNGVALSWKTEVKDVQSPQFIEANVTGLREILVDVSWQQRLGYKHLLMSTYVADGQLQ